MMAEMLTQPDAVRILTEEMADFVLAYAQNRNLLRFHYHRPDQILSRLRDLQRDQLTFTAVPDFDPQRQFFISDDEGDHLLREAEDRHEYRLGVYSFFLAHMDDKERERYLRGIHGEYSGSYSGNDNILYNTKGITFSHGDLTKPYAETVWSWRVVTKRIEKLIQQDQFLSGADREAMPEYERKQVAQAVINGLRDAPDYIPRPYTGNPITDYWENVRQIQEQLTDPERVEAIFTSLTQVMDMTLPNDRNYTARQQAVQTMEAFRDGTYSLFGERREPVQQQENNDQETVGVQDEPAQSEEKADTSMNAEPPVDPVPAPIHRELSQADIDAALQEWNGNMDSKRAVVRYMREHGRERGTAAWLRQE